MIAVPRRRDSAVHFCEEQGCLIPFIQLLYVVSALGLAVIGFNAFVLSITYLRRRKDSTPLPHIDAGAEWPTVVVQLPIFNERHVVERLVDAVSRLDYPPNRLSIQLLDDSTDDTPGIAAAAIERAVQRRLDARHIRRERRTGYKSGALAHGLAESQAEFVAIFDADFVPDPDFLQQVIPYLMVDASLGMVQTRWAHLNAGHSPLTRAEAVALDSHFVVEQTARQRGGLLMNFSGTAGVWRRTCIEDSGGWQHDTLSEDIDLSYRAQLKGWKCLYLPEVGSPAEIPPLVMAFKRQQSRWATGTVQCLCKLGGTVLGSHLSAWQKIQAMIHLGGYFIHPLMIVLMVTSLPLMLTGHLNQLPLAGLGLSMFGPPLQALIAQRTLYIDWRKRMLYFPMLMLVGVGIAVNNTLAVLKGLSGKMYAFQRTPKFQVEGHDRAWAASSYMLPVDGSTVLEIILALYAGVAAVVAARLASPLVPFMVLYALGFAYTVGLSGWQTLEARRARARQRGLDFEQVSVQ